MNGPYPHIRHHEASPEGRRLLIRESVRITFYVPRHHHELADTVSRALDVYLQAVGEGAETLGFYISPEGDRFPLDEAGWRFVRSCLQTGDSQPPLRSVEELEPEAFQQMLKQGSETSLHLAGGATDVSGYAFDYVARIPWRLPSDELSVVSFSLPTEYLEEHGPKQTRELATKLATMLPWVSGHGGLAFFLPNRLRSTMQAIREEVFRHPGLDVPRAGVRDSLGSRVDGVHWLNFLGPAVLEELGGAGGLRARLRSPGTEVQEMEGGRAVVVLGEWPEAGDLARGLDLPAYRELAHVLEPWLYEPSSRWSGFTPDEMRRWERRFLD